MDIPGPLAHGFALALAGRCPLCAERTGDPGLLSGRPCTRCGGALGAPGLGDALLGHYRSTSNERLGLGLLALGAVGLVVGFVPLLGAGLMAGSAIFFQLRVIAPALALMGRVRRMVARWTLRLLTSVVFLGASLGTVIASAAGLGGPATAVLAPVSLGSVWVGARAYLLWQLGRERRGRPVALSEWLLLGFVVGFAALATLVLATVAAAALAVLERAVAEVLRWL